MKIALTICSNNYLAQALVLSESFLSYNPEYYFVLGIADTRHEQINYSMFDKVEVIFIEELGIEDFSELKLKYNIIELNTCFKPIIIKYLLEKYKQASSICYLDPDILITNKFTCIEDEIRNFNVLLTPHIITPIPDDDCHPKENLFLKYGIFNLGFIYLNRSKETDILIDWWDSRVRKYGFMDSKNGYFTDQLWVNFFPVFFEKIKVSKNLGLNMAVWNLHERFITIEDEKFFINNKYPLIFFHFSGFSPYYNTHLSDIKYDRYNLLNRADLLEICEVYRQKLIRNNYVYFTKIEYGFKNMVAADANEKKNASKSFIAKARIKRVIEKSISKIISIIKD